LGHRRQRKEEEQGVKGVEGYRRDTGEREGGKKSKVKEEEEQGLDE
jgi:hypothetical protein